MTKTTEQPTTTCQICGRPIKANSGLIAHHGYKRPAHQGWQTKSCFGARNLPYEVSCDVIPVAIESAKAFITRSESAIQNLMDNPPEELEYVWSRGRRMETIKATRPVDFDSHKDYYYPRSTSYEYMFERRIAELKISIAQAREDVAYLETRLARWVAPEGLVTK